MKSRQILQVRDGQILGAEKTFTSTFTETEDGAFALQYEVNSEDMIKEFQRGPTVQLAKNGEFDPEAELFTVTFTEKHVKEIAIAQLNLVKKDLERVGGKSFKDPDYLSAMEFVQTDGFIKCCVVAGMDADDSANRAEYLARRYSKAYVMEINKAMDMAPNLQYRIVNTLEFAFELACELFEMRNDSTFELKDKLTSVTYWNYLDHNGVKADVVKRHLNHLISELRLNNSL
ncbi:MULTISPECIES: hypothetical protein [Vibrio harveyi group]|uniref:Uncharacterized protein n=1 Tax=Vibrio owensii CAIM 1854 = LMG 25443 TaxID=1229493 RepID=A0A0C1ZJV1_9VIBR|nr:hypothetical protein [Vibrio owensii]KIF53461.1 hypothetical protein H735_11165 [Vibrio owensii CAIM 1854 = LMG 25443]